ncbi:hypothetical protein BU25DRAFT_152859 [Macroventuria anomochaeta]|uniref:Uncharacterized protein n=1 Tax=Macroventuria anomochaeta TaxID=301207 RepID=A0ACB6RTT9_9PLEO|nr:uncharacterized protein BU25DRAFT_152859 [Macroventuria anomochaeta]KAF2624458.1 hypothetical protein BU25DRAFT_152859 [Macroventuria anomochaeta]
MDALPEELLSQIVSHVEQQQGLVGLCRMNRRLNRIATPVLYAQYQTSYGSIPSHYLTTLIRRPELASRVKSLRWDYSTLAKHRISVFDSNDLQHTLRAFEYPVSTFAARCAESMETAQENGELTDAFFTTVLLHTPNLEEIEIIDKWYGDDVRSTRRWLDPIRMKVPHGFHHLKSASVTMACMQFDDVIILMHLPSLRRLQLCNLVEPEVRPVGLGIPPQPFSNVDDLSFRSCRLNWKTVAWTMAPCKVLRRFSYVSFNLALLRLSIPSDLQDLKKTLDKHSADLEYLDIEVDVLVSNGEDHGEFESFAGYPQLKHQRVWLNPFKPYRELGLLTP